MLSGRPSVALRLASVVLLSALASGGAAHAQPIATRIQQVRSELANVESRLGLLDSTYIAPAVRVDENLERHRLADGRLLFVLEDYPRAAIVFLDILERSSDQRTPTYRDARWYLSESLFLSRNYAAARGFYRETAADAGDPRRADGVRRLLEIHFRTQRYDGIDELYALLDSMPEAASRSDIVYIRAKGLYFQEAYAAAADMFARIAEGDTEYIQAQYFRGVSLARLESWGNAIAAFENARDAGPTSSNPEAAEIVALANLALGRIHYETGDPQAARVAYQAVSRTSESFDRALYEMGWTYIAQERYRDALNTLEILLLAVPDSRFRPNAQLLRGDLLMRLASYEEAMAIFDRTVEQFGPLADLLSTIVRQESDPNQYFAALVDSGSASLTIPDIARDWVEDDLTMRRALELIDDLEVQAGEIAESREIIAELETVLSAASRVDVVPEMREAFGIALELQHLLLMLEARLVDLDAEISLPAAGADVRTEYGGLQGERDYLEREMAALPRTYEELTAQEASVEGQLRDMEIEIFRLGYEIESQYAQLRALRRHVRAEFESGERSESSFREAERGLDSFERELQGLEALRDEMRRELEQERLGTGLGSLSANTLAGLRARYRELLTRQALMLRPVHGGLDASGQSNVAEIEQVRGAIAELDGALRRTFSAIDDVVDQRTREVRRQVDVEAARIDEYERQLSRYGDSGERLAGEIAYENFIDVQSQFSDMILRADVGIIDVAWREKEDRSERIETLFDERNEQLEVLDIEFREVLESE